jgi:very-short-patch-repair endonuclease
MNARELRKGQTDAEALLWLLLRDRRLAGFKFRRQHPVPPYVLDFYCHEKRLAVELDGGQHAEQVTKDERRMRELAKQGIRVLRFWDNQVLGEIGAVLEALWSALYEEEGRDSPHPEPLSRGARGFEESPHPNPSPGGRGALPEIDLGERAFEIVMARQMAAGELETAWFERHRSTPITEIPAHWPEDYRRLVERRIALIEQDRNVGLIERPEYKRRWNQEPWEAQEQRALRGWLLDRVETPTYWPDLGLQTTRRLADRAGRDGDFMQVAEIYRGHPDFDVDALVAELVESEAVPFLPVLRYKPSGLRKRELWERTWELQRREDAIDAEVEVAVGCGEERTASIAGGADPTAEEKKRRKQQEIGDIPPPPKYKSADFLNTTFWRLRGALDVPKERFVSYPHCSKTSDPSLVVAWAGWDHLQQAQAPRRLLPEHQRPGRLGARAPHPAPRRPPGADPLDQSLLELIPWINQWHNDPDPNFSGARMGDYFESFVDEEARELRLTPEQIRSWQPSHKGVPTRRLSNQRDAR